MKFSIKDFFSNCDQIRSFLRIWSHLLKKSLMENVIFLCSVLKTLVNLSKIRKQKSKDLQLNKKTWKRAVNQIVPRNFSWWSKNNLFTCFSNIFLTTEIILTARQLSAIDLLKLCIVRYWDSKTRFFQKNIEKIS